MGVGQWLGRVAFCVVASKEKRDGRSLLNKEERLAEMKKKM